MDGETFEMLMGHKTTLRDYCTYISKVSLTNLQSASRGLAPKALRKFLSIGLCRALNTLVQPSDAAHTKLKVDPQFLELCRLEREANQKFLLMTFIEDLNFEVLKFAQTAMRSFATKFLEAEFKWKYEVHIIKQRISCPSSHEEDVVKILFMEHHVNIRLRIHKVFKEEYFL